MRILICERIAREGQERLSNAGLEIDIQTGISKESLLEIIHEYEILIISEETIIDKEILLNAKNLKIIAKAGTGFENIDTEYCHTNGIKIIHTPGINSNAVAELIIGLIIDLVRGITFADRYVREGNTKFARQMGFELVGKTVAVIGLGPIGRNVADKCSALGMKVLGHTKTETNDLFDKIKLVTFEQAVCSAEIVVLTIPRNQKTFHVISADEFSMMKDGVILINASPKGVLDEIVLLESLNNGKIRAAALDAFEDYPIPSKHPITKYDNVLLTPHLGGLTEETQIKISIELAEKIIRNINSET